MKSVAVFAVFAFAAAANAQTGVIDQVSPVVGASFNLDAPSLTWQQQIRAGVDGQLEGIEIRTLGPAGAECSVRVREGEAWSVQAPVFDGMIVKTTPDAEVIFIDMTSAGIMLGEGDAFVMETMGNGTGMNITGSYVDPAMGPPEYPEPLFLNQGSYADGGWRHGFTTYMLTDTVCYADCDESGGLDFFDFLCFQNAFAAGEPYADCDESGGLDFFDFLCYQNAFAAGCP